MKRAYLAATASFATLILLTVALNRWSAVAVSDTQDQIAPTPAISSTANRGTTARRARPSLPPIASEAIDTVVVPLESKAASARYSMTDPELVGSIWGSQKLSTPKALPARGGSTALGTETAAIAQPGSESGASVAQTSFAGPTIDDDKAETAPIAPPGLRFIPPDPIGAAGPDHLVDVINVLVNFYQQDGTMDFQDSLYDFFSVLTPSTFTFDPKVVYDQHEGRFVIVTMDVTDTQFDDPSDTSRIFVAVSDDSNPNGSWCMGSLDGFSTFIGEADDQNALDHFAEYPGLAVDDEAVYISAEMRTFLDQTPPDTFGGVRLWIIDKAADGLYDCGANPVALGTVDVFDPFAGGGVVLTSQPAQIYGSAPAGLGTFLVSKGNLTDGTNEFAQTIRIDDPLTAPSFTQSFINLGDIEDMVGNPTDPPLPGAPQSGSAELIDTNDRRVLDAVWREDNLYFASVIDPKPGDPDAGQATAFWARIDTTNLASLTVTDQGVVLGEDIAAGTYTFYPSIAVDNTGAMAIGFAASAPTIFPGAYFTYRQAADSAGTTGPSSLVQAGEAAYFREFETGRNRWGDYTGITAHPLDAGCFWVFNQYAGEQDQVDDPPENGRWETQWAEFCVADSEIFADGFESGDTSAWSSTVP